MLARMQPSPVAKRMRHLAAALVVSLAAQSGAVGPPPTPAQEPAEGALQNRLPGHPTDVKSPPPPRRIPPLRDPARVRVPPTYHTLGCDFDGLVEKVGAAFVAHVRAVPFDCFSALFSTAPIATRVAVFREPNVLAVARAAHQLIAAYNRVAAVPLNNLLYYFQAGVFAEFHTDELQWSRAVRREIYAVVGSLLANPSFFADASHEAGNLVVTVFAVANAPGARLRYLSAAVDWLSRWSAARAQIDGQRRGAAEVFVLVFACHSDLGFRAVVDDLPIIADVFRDIALSESMLGTDAETIASDAGGELARFLAYADLPWRPRVLAGVRQILNRYEPLGLGASVWAATAGAAVFYEPCSTFHICEELDGLEPAVLSVEHSCGDGIFIRGQEFDADQLAAACAALRRTERVFHWRLKTGRQPVADDLTARHEIVAFANYANYRTYSSLFFGNPTDNGGIYYEGDPSQPGNVSRHLGYVADYLPDKPIWNLEHEYVHHLDGRFNFHGPFWDYRVDTHKTVWWIEGLAEYLSYRDDNEAAIALAEGGTLPLDVVAEATYSSGLDRVYRWSYLAVRFLFERHPEMVAQLLGYIRVGDYDGYLSYVNVALAATPAAQWPAWASAVKALPDYDVAAVELPLPRGLSVFDDETAVALVDVAGAHPTGQGITVSAASSDPDVAIVEVAGSRLIINAVGLGEATISVSVGDAWGSTRQRVNLEVTTDCPRWLCPTILSGWRAVVLAPSEE